MKKCLAIILLNTVMEVLPYIIVNKHAYIRKEKTKLSLSVMIHILCRKQPILIIYKSYIIHLNNLQVIIYDEYLGALME